MYAELPSKEILEDLLEYNPETGELKFKANGKQAGTEQNTGIRICINYKRYLAHRLIWVLMTGEDPKELTVDHINRDNKDNRWANLRLATQEEQNLNRGFKGYYRLPDGRYRATISRSFKTEAEAEAWRKQILSVTAGEFAPA